MGADAGSKAMDMSEALCVSHCSAMTPLLAGDRDALAEAVRTGGGVRCGARDVRRGGWGGVTALVATALAWLACSVAAGHGSPSPAWNSPRLANGSGVACAKAFCCAGADGAHDRVGCMLLAMAAP